MSDQASAERAPAGDAVARERLGALVDLKRVRPGGGVPLAERAFARAWGAIAAGEDPELVARRELADALAQTVLGGIDASALRSGGLGDAAIGAILTRALRQAGGDEELAGALDPWAPDAPAPPFVAALSAQPRAGVTAPDRPRLVLEPAETHGGHCATVAVLAALLALQDGVAPGAPFVCGLAHHLHNAVLPDGGFAGEMALGDALEPVVSALTEQALAQLDPGPAATVRDALGCVGHVETAEARAFNEADVLDRVLELAWHEQAARFETRVALEDFDLVHAGPLQAFGRDVLRRWDLWR